VLILVSFSRRGSEQQFLLLPIAGGQGQNQISGRVNTFIMCRPTAVSGDSLATISVN
jgi:hypothetical protein